MLCGATCVIAVYALSRERCSILTKFVIPTAGFAANAVMTVTLIWLSLTGGSATQMAGLIAITTVGIWMVTGLAYFAVNSRSKESSLFSFPEEGK